MNVFLCVCLLRSWPQSIRTNGAHLSHISYGAKWGRRPRTFSITVWQYRHTQDKHTNKNRPHTRTHSCGQAEVVGHTSWIFVSGDSSRTTSSSKSKSSQEPLRQHCLLYSIPVRSAALSFTHTTAETKPSPPRAKRQRAKIRYFYCFPFCRV